MVAANFNRGALIAWCVFSLALQCLKLDSREFWQDEVLTFEATQKSWWALVEERYWSGHSPLYFLMAKLILQITNAPLEPGMVEWILRLPSAILVTAAGALLIHAIWNVAGHRAAILLAVLWICWPPLVHYSHEARPYGLLIFFCSLGVWGTLHLLRDMRLARDGEQDGASARLGSLHLWASAVGSIGAAATMPVGIVAAIALEASTFLACFTTALPALWKRRCLIVWPLLLILIALFVPALMARAANYWTETREPAKFGLANIWSVLKKSYAPGPTLLFVVPPVLLLGYAIGARWQSRQPGRRHPELSLLWAGALLIPALLLLASLNTSVLVHRYFLPTLCFSLPLYAVLMARGRTRAAFVVSSAMVVVTLIAGVRTYVKTETKAYSEIRALLDKHDIREATLYAQAGLDQKAVAFYLGDRVSRVLDNERDAGLGDVGGHPSWVVRRKIEPASPAASLEGGASSQCSFTLSDHIVTFVARDPSHLQRLRGGCG
jgi:4-amino-4-deoxy-L-arabinose transferase-like glycosyltransferase